MQRKVTSALLTSELIFTTSRSGGPGGQNVNKVNTKVTVKLDVGNSSILTDEEKEVILIVLKTKLTTDGVLIISSQEKRSQLQNKESVIQKLDRLLLKAFEKKKVRKATKPTKTSIQAQIKKKKQHAEKKQRRQKPLD